MTRNVKSEISSSVAGARTQPRSPRGQKRRARILQAAAELFLDRGYGETAIDAIVERSGGSKATLYSYFPTKEDLFHAVVDDIVSNRQQPPNEVSGDLRAALIMLAVQRMKVVFSSQHRQLLRLIVAEHDRFPAIAAMYYEHGPKRSHDMLVGYMWQLKERGLLQIDSPEESAEFLIGMLVHQWYLVQLYLQAPPPSEQAMHERATHVVDRFLEAFGYPEGGTSRGEAGVEIKPDPQPTTKAKTGTTAKSRTKTGATAKTKSKSKTATPPKTRPGPKPQTRTGTQAGTETPAKARAAAGRSGSGRDTQS